MRCFAILLAVFAVGVVLAAEEGTVRAAEEELSATTKDVYRCAVCRQSISWLWDVAAQARRECQHPDNETAISRQCELTVLQEEHLVDVLEGHCDSMAFRHRVEMQGELPAIVEDDHEDAEMARRIRTICAAWLHADHHAEKIAKYVTGNVNAKKLKETILPRLQHRFCMSACEMKKITDRRKRPDLIHGERHVDYSRAQIIEASRSASISKALDDNSEKDEF
jgi:hypothetical protein